MNRNYSNAEKRKRTDKYVHEHHAYDKKETLDMWMWGTFHNRSEVIVNWENVWTNSYVKCTKPCKKQPIFVSKRNSIEKETSEIFDCTRWFSLQSLNSIIRLFKVLEIIRIWELLFWSVGSYFSFKLLYLQWKTALPLSGN